jgi:hypothetical protein
MNRLYTACHLIGIDWSTLKKKLNKAKLKKFVLQPERNLLQKHAGQV